MVATAQYSMCIRQNLHTAVRLGYANIVEQRPLASLSLNTNLSYMLLCILSTTVSDDSTLGSPQGFPSSTACKRSPSMLFDLTLAPGLPAFYRHFGSRFLPL